MNPMTPMMVVFLVAGLVLVFIHVSEIAFSLYDWLSLEKVNNSQVYGFEGDMDGRIYVFSINESMCIAVVRNGVGGADCN